MREQRLEIREQKSESREQKAELRGVSVGKGLRQAQPDNLRGGSVTLSLSKGALIDSFLNIIKYFRFGKNTLNYTLLNSIAFSIFLLSFSLLSSCKDGGKIEYYPTVEEMNKGVVKVQCDEALQSIMKQQAEIFELNFPEAKIEFEFLPEQIIVENLLSGRCRTAVISRKLSEAEFKKVETTNSIKPREHAAAKNAIAIVTSSENKSNKIALAELQQILSSGSKTVVVEGKQSYMAKTIAEGLNLQNIQSKFFALNTADSVVSYVRNNKDVLGFISFSAISDENAYRTKELLKGISVMQLESKKDTTLITTSANQSDIYVGDYPLVTPVNYIVTDFKDKLSIGFVNFLYKPKAGRIFLHAGLVPSVMPEREIVIDTNSTPNAK